MLVNMIDLNGDTKQYYNVKKVYEWTIKATNKDGNPEKYEIYLIYDENGYLQGFGWKDEEPQSLIFILNIVKTGGYAKVVPLTLEEYRKKNNEVRTVKVTVNKNNSYSLYLPTSWSKEFLKGDLYVDLHYTGDAIIIKKSIKEYNDEISE